ncbi:MAG: putative DNA binding domain-containing protein [Opitutaceae bacterium]|nr:putative DNA binding domain-containing protein [Opitutaceae bacterium]
MHEGITLDKKSIRIFATAPAKWSWLEIAKDCVGFANARGGRLLFGIEDDADQPPVAQQIDAGLPERLRRGISQHTLNVATSSEILTASNGGQYLELRVLPSQRTLAATTDGRYYIRLADTTQPILPDELVRVAAEKDSYQWETQTTRRISFERADPAKLLHFVRSIRASDRVKDHVKERTDLELLEHYFFVIEGHLTNLGVLWVGNRTDRAQLLHAPVLQFCKYDSRGDRVSKRLWDDYSLNPAELIEAIWTEIPDWRESTELPDGLFRKQVPHYDEVVLRELVANALVHRPYTTRGDLFINLHPEHLEIHNPGLLPLGVTPANILQKTIRRNNHLAQVFHDLRLMEREGTGYDRIYETQLAQGKAIPVVQEEEDRVIVRIERRILKPELIDFLARAHEQLALTQREHIALGLIAQHESVTAMEFARLLQIEGDARLRSWLGSLLDRKVVLSSGRTRGTEYFVNPDVLRATHYQGRTTLKKIEAHRLRHLVLEDLAIYGPTASQGVKISEIHQRIGTEISRDKLSRCIEHLRALGQVIATGQRGTTRYSIGQNTAK